MADSDSFINEVTEEVRRDRLFSLMRRWGWLPALAIVGVVGGAAYFEVQRTQEMATAQAFGDALLAGLDEADVTARVAALEAIDPGSVEAAMILALLESGELAGAGDAGAAAATLRAAAETPQIDRRYRDLALLRAEMLAPSEPSQARMILETLGEPGAPYAGLAQEQLALLALREGDIDRALELFRRIEAGAATTAGLQQRASQLIVAIEAGSTLVDTAPSPVAEETDADAAQDSAAPSDLGADAAPETQTGAETETEGADPGAPASE